MVEHKMPDDLANVNDGDVGINQEGERFVVSRRPDGKLVMTTFQRNGWQKTTVLGAHHDGGK